MNFIKSKIITSLWVITNNIILPFFQNFYFLKPYFTSLFNFFDMFTSWIIIKFLKRTVSYLLLCLYFIRLFITVTKILLLSSNLITSSDSLLNRTSFLQFFKVLLSSSERFDMIQFSIAE